MFVVLSVLNVTRRFVLSNLSYRISVATDTSIVHNKTLQDINSDGRQIDKKSWKKSLNSA
jgi:hypothetical protein